MHVDWQNYFWVTFQDLVKDLLSFFIKGTLELCLLFSWLYVDLRALNNANLIDNKLSWFTNFLTTNSIIKFQWDIFIRIRFIIIMSGKNNYLVKFPWLSLNKETQMFQPPRVWNDYEIYSLFQLDVIKMVHMHVCN